MVQDYLKYGVSDFLTDDTFIEHHLNPTQTKMNEWTEAQKNAAYHEAVNILNAIKLGLKDYQNTVLPEDTKSFIFHKIQETNKRNSTKKFYKKPVVWLSAAAVLLMVGIGVVVSSLDSSYKQNLAQIKQNVVEKKNLTNKTLLVHLPDGSAVKLEPKSKISFSEGFQNEKRIVILSGEATFDIAKDPTRPFLVFANEVTTKVLGTRFHVKAFESMKKIEVTVEEGKVSVYKNKLSKTAENELTGVILLPNQQAIFDRETDEYNKKII